MNSTMERLRQGQRCWTAEFALRSAGLLLLGLCALMWSALCRLGNQPLHHAGNPRDFALAAIIWLCLSPGLALTIEGAGLFKLVPLPPRALI